MQESLGKWPETTELATREEIVNKQAVEIVDVEQSDCPHRESWIDSLE